MLNQKIKSKAFTIVELLTVISVITLIIGLLVPALNKVNRIAKDMKQGVQFHAITTALEMFKAENGDYPSSANSGTSSNIICGAHKLAEALVGRDLQGFDPKSDMDDPEKAGIEAYGYTVNAYDEAKFKDSLDRRKGPYLNQENVGAFGIGQLFSNPDVVYPGKYDTIGNTLTGSGSNPAPVITDIYRTIRVSIPIGATAKKSVQAGTPVLYYKANIANKFNDITSTAEADIAASSIYNIYDNDEIVKLGTIKDPLVQHKIDSTVTTPSKGIDTFYDNMRNNVASASLSTGLSRPYRPDSYILISAGFDGIYGTNDDVTNYEE